MPLIYSHVLLKADFFIQYILFVDSSLPTPLSSSSPQLPSDPYVYSFLLRKTTTTTATGI